MRPACPPQECARQLHSKGQLFALLLIPSLVSYLVPYTGSPVTTTLRTIFFILSLAIFAAPIRERIPFVATMFLSYDRPEDRPFTLLWLVTQLAAGYLIVAPLSLYFAHSGMAQLMFILILTHGLGDGLAEPIGVRFGKHKYATRALFTDRRYTRSLEGSACVLVAGLVAVAVFHASFTPTQLWLALVTVPTLMSLAEAVSPHTWDTPLMFTAGGISLAAIKQLA